MTSMRSVQEASKAVCAGKNKRSTVEWEGSSKCSVVCSLVWLNGVWWSWLGAVVVEEAQVK